MALHPIKTIRFLKKDLFPISREPKQGNETRSMPEIKLAVIK